MCHSLPARQRDDLRRPPSPIVSAVVKFSPLSCSIRLPSSTLVPSMRMTIGTGTPSSLTAAITPCGEHVAAQDAAEDVDEHRLHVLVRHQDLERVADLLGVGAAADVEEVRRLAARQLDDVHRRHRQAGAVDHAADVAVEADVVERELRRLDLERVLFARGRAARGCRGGGRARCRRSSSSRRAPAGRRSSVTISGLISISDASVADERLVERGHQLDDLASPARPSRPSAKRELAAPGTARGRRRDRCTP